MTWLIWKDYRLNRLILIVALVLLVMPYLGVATGAWNRTFSPRVGMLGLSDDLVSASALSLVMLQVMLAFLGGNAIAGERADRSAEFLASLPISRRRILASKLLVSLAVGALVLIPNLIILAVAFHTQQPSVAGRELYMLGNFATTGLTFFCVAWLLSSTLESPTFSVCAGLLAPFVLLMGVALTLFFLPGRPNDLFERHMFLGYHIGCLTLSALSFVGGTLYYLRRVEP